MLLEFPGRSVTVDPFTNPNSTTQRDSGSANALLTAVVVSSIGDLLFDLYVAWALATKYETIMAAAGVIGASLLFRALLAFFLGSVVDRLKKRAALVAANVGSVLVLAVFLFLGDAALESVPLAVGLVLANDVFNELFSRAYVVAGSILLSEDRFV